VNASISFVRIYLIIDITITLFPELLCRTECIGGVIMDRVPVSFAKDINFEFELSTTPSIEVCVVGFGFLFVGVKVVPSPALVSACRHVCTKKYMSKDIYRT
jgi:hypothetical protein